MTPEEREKLLKELEQIKAENARDMEMLESAPLDDSGATKSVLPSPSALMGWNEDHSIAGEQSDAYRDKKRADEAVSEAQETINQDGGVLSSVGDAYGGVGSSLVGAAESVLGTIDAGDALTAGLVGTAALEGGNYIRDGYRDAKTKSNQAELEKEAPTKRTEKILTPQGKPLERYVYEEGSVKEQANKLKSFQDKLAKDGIDYEELKKRPGTMLEKIQSVYKERLAEKYPTWASRTGMGKIAGKIKGKTPGRNALVTGMTRTGGVALGLPAVYGIAESFGTGKEIEEAEKELPALMEKAKQYDLEYKGAMLDYADSWLARNNPSSVPPGVYEKRLATRALLEAQIKEGRK